MLGAIVGDVIGSIYEHPTNNVLTTDFPLFSWSSGFTDDTVLTVAVAESLVRGSDLVELFKSYYARFPNAGYGGTFRRWAKEPSAIEPYGSWGNGSAMRVSPVGWAFDDLAETLERAKATAEVTHNHPEGIKGAQAIALAVFLARNRASKGEIREAIEREFGYDLSPTVEYLRAHATFDVSCQGSVPPALIAFLASNDFENAIRLAVSIGGDSDTIACMAGAVAEPFYGGVPAAIRDEALNRLHLGLMDVVTEFTQRFVVPMLG